MEKTSRRSNARRDPGIEPERAEVPDPHRNEQRRHVRKNVLWAAKLETMDGSFDCIALNVSRGGAKLRLASPMVPQTAGDLTLGSHGRFAAQIIWQRLDRIGVRFCAAPEEVARIIGPALSL